MKIIFLGTSNFGAIILKKIIEGGYVPSLVVTAPDKPSGRKQIITPPPVKITAQSYELPIEQPEKIKNLTLEIRNLNPDLIITAAYGQIVPQEILDIPKFGSLNVHPSLLPKYRGASPVQSAILNGDKKTGVTIMLMDSMMDHGPIIAQKETSIGDNENFAKLHDRLAIIGGELLLDTIPDWINGKIEARHQNESDAVYTKTLKKEDGLIDWSKPANAIERQIRAFSPWPGTYTFWKKNKKDMRLKILESFIEDDKLILVQVQPEGKKPMTFAEFLRGNPEFNNNKKICSRIRI